MYTMMIPETKLHLCQAVKLWILSGFLLIYPGPHYHLSRLYMFTL